MNYLGCYVVPIPLDNGLACGVVAMLAGFHAVAHPAPWLAFAAWFRALPIT